MNEPFTKKNHLDRLNINLETQMIRYEALLSPREIQLKSLENWLDNASQKYQERLEQVFVIDTESDADN